MVDDGHGSLIGGFNKLCVDTVDGSVSLDSLLSQLSRECLHGLVFFIPITGVCRVESIKIFLEVIAEPSFQLRLMFCF